ncbi:MAG TPA: hypothetical protein VM661_13380 [Candidatus Sulfotelmatobacter sp.]|nr:hypothetical protein [Candidatus Sulfotelmatobacter sp.]
MTPQEFQDLVDSLGEDFQDWPKNVVGEARRLVQASDEAQDILEQAERLRRQLADLGHQAPSLFADKVVALAMELDPPEDDDLLLN